MPFKSARTKFLFLSCAIVTLGLGYFTMTHRSARVGNFSSQSLDTYNKKIQPLFNLRCVVCHSCNTAPCQLNLTNFDGLDRGASHQALYMPARSQQTAPTRFGVDAFSTEAWRRLGFFSVLTGNGQASTRSIFAQILEMKTLNPSAPVDLSPETSAVCPGNDVEFAQFKKSRPEAGMPYGLPALSLRETDELNQWLTAGARGSVPAAPSRPQLVQKIEAFFNSNSLEGQLVARYLFEHLFLAHLHLDGTDDREFYRLARSSSSCDSGIQEIPSRRPNSDPGTPRIYYCLKFIDQTIVDKSHLLYEMSEQRLARWQQIFFAQPWRVTHLPSYDEKTSANPFVTFQELPAASRYQWLLDDARYTVMTFIRGPVCRGQTAVDVIDEQFNVFFLDPKADHFVNNRKYAEQVAPYLRVPAELGSGAPNSLTGAISEGGYYAKLVADRNRYRNARFQQFIQDRPRGYSLDDLWTGDGTNRNAYLTVLRHYDSAEVVFGHLGPVPKTSFVLDYPLFERIVYNLVVGFDVFGDMAHQVLTREYKHLLRLESEENYLTFLPPEIRHDLHDYFYRGGNLATGWLTKQRVDHWSALLPVRGHMAPTQVVFNAPISPSNEETWFKIKKEFIQQLRARMTPEVRGPDDTLNCCERTPFTPIAQSITSVEQFEAELHKITSRYAAEMPYSNFIDDTMLLHLVVDGHDKDELYTFIRNREHKNVAWIVAENLRRAPKEDLMFVAHGVAASYPNRFLVVQLKDASAFLNGLATMKTGEQYRQWLERFAILRSNRDFWTHSDWFQNKHLSMKPREAGILDLGRYEFGGKD